MDQLTVSCILIFTISAANSDQYIATRTLYGMAKDGNAPKVSFITFPYYTQADARSLPDVLPEVSPMSHSHSLDASWDSPT